MEHEKQYIAVINKFFVEAPNKACQLDLKANENNNHLSTFCLA